jgi:hypothetical protein
MKEPVKKNKKISILVFLFFIIMLFYIFFLKEFNAYRSSLNTKDLSKIDAYLVKYPNGRYSSEIKAHLENEAYSRVVSDSSSSDIDNYYIFCQEGKHMQDVLFIDLYLSRSIKKAKDFLANYPNSPYREKVAAKIDQLWDDEIKLYEKKVLTYRSGVNVKSVKFFRDLLKYMKENQLTTFYIRFYKNTKIKDYKEYPVESRNICKFFYALETKDLSIIGLAPPSDSNVYSVRSNFSEEGILDLEKNVGDEIVNSFHSIFSKDFFNFSIIHSDDPAKVPDKNIVIDLKYRIENDEDEFSGNLVPNLWQSTESYTELPSSKRFKGYILALKVEFMINIINIGNKDVFSISEKGNPGSEISGFENYREAYKIMVGNNFTDFIKKVSLKLGLSSR